MKKLLLIFAAIVTIGSSNAQQVFFQESFEDTLGWTISNLFDDGFEDYVLNDSVAVINARSSGPDFTILGADSTHIIAFEDINSGDPGSASSNGEVTFTIDSITISGRSNLSIWMAAAANPTSGRYDKALNWFGSNGNGDTISVEVKIDGGNYTKVMYFCADSAGAGNQSNTGSLYFDKNLNYDGGDATGELALNDTLTDFSAAISGTGRYLSIRNKVRVESGDEEFVMDNIRLAESCDAPSNLASSNIDTTSATITWTGGGSGFYQIEYGATGFTQGTGTLDTTSTASYNISGLTPNTTYQVYVKDSCTNLSSAWVGPISFTTQSNTCNAPTNFQQVFVGDTFALLTWTTGGANAWNLQYGSSGFTIGSGTIISNINAFPFNLTGLMAGTSYDVYVQDTCGGGLGSSAWVGPINVNTLANPSVLSATPTSSTTIEVVFSDSMDVTTTTDIGNYGGVTLSSAVLNTAQTMATLNLSTPISNGANTSLQISNSILSARQIALDSFYTFNFLWNSSTPAIVITEIMYNDRSSNDSLEFIEFYNNGTTPAQLGGMELTQGVDYTFPAGATLASGSYAVLAVNSSAMNSVFGYSGALEFDGGRLSNSGEDILLVNTLGDTVDYVLYDDRAPWDWQADGAGYSIVLCDANDDNNLVGSWWRETNINAGYRTSPGAANNCWPSTYTPDARTIGQMTTVDQDGSLDSLGSNCALTGTVFTIDYDGNSGYSFYMYDSTGGLLVFEFADQGSYQSSVGDSITAYGTISQFNGLTQFRVDSVVVLDSNVALIDPAVVTMLEESTEGEYIKIENVRLADTADWRASGSFNIDIVTVADDTLTMRIDSDTDVLSVWTSAPKDNFDLTGVGGQFDGTFPYNGGYQIFPRFATDIDTSTCLVPTGVGTSNIDSTSADLVWMGAANADIEYGTAGFTPGTGMQVNGIASPYSLTGLSDTTDYEFYVRQVCSSKNSAWEGPYAFTTLAGPGPASIEVIRSQNDFRAFPNPVNGDLVRFNRSANIRVMDVLGNFLMAKENATSLDVSNLSSGMYFLVESEGTMIKLIVE